MTLIHDGAHRCFHPNSRVNDFLTDFLCAFPLLTFTQSYRAFHLCHHRFEGDKEKDPEIAVYNHQGRGVRDFQFFLSFILKGLTGYSSVLFIRDFLRFIQRPEILAIFPMPSARRNILFLCYHFGLIAVCYGLTGSVWILLFWYYCYISFAMMFLKLHGLGEHQISAYEKHDVPYTTYTRRCSPLLWFFVYPLNSGLHLEHHSFSSVPWYKLPEVRKKMEGSAKYRDEIQSMTLESYFFGANSVISREYKKRSSNNELLSVS